MNISVMRSLSLCVLSASLLSACGGGALATVGGTLSGLNAGLNVVLQNNGSDNLTLTANGSFNFATTVASGSAYSVAVLTQPTGQTCTVTNATGTIDNIGSTVSNVQVSCVASSSLGGTVTGLKAGTSLTLNINGTSMIIATNGSFAYPGILTTGSAYSVTVSVPPAGESCTVTNGTGVISASSATAVAVVCQ